MANRFCLWVLTFVCQTARPQRRFIELQQFFAGAPKTIAPNLPCQWARLRSIQRRAVYTRVACPVALVKCKQ